ncbi:hypothetical protein OAB57_02445 [Bacteriovoracaceae bacterium]|nr:hypothetical protein [Bacteriovoracaceae bacterium]
MKIGVFLLSILFCQIVRSDVFVFVTEKQKKVQQSRWSLTDWLITKKKMALMDQWLALNSSSNFFEGHLFGGRGSLEREHTESGILQTKHKDTYSQLGIELYFSLLGLSYEIENTHSDFSSQYAHISLRLLGAANQGTHITVFYGAGQLKEFDNRYDTQLVGGQVSLYLTSFLGGFSRYSHFFSGKSRDKIDTFSGNEMKLGGFIELGFLRLSIQKHILKTKVSGSTIDSATRREKYSGALHVYF